MLRHNGCEQIDDEDSAVLTENEAELVAANAEKNYGATRMRERPGEPKGVGGGGVS